MYVEVEGLGFRAWLFGELHSKIFVPDAVIGSFPKQGDPNIESYSPYYGDPQNGTPDFGKPPIM